MANTGLVDEYRLLLRDNAMDVRVQGRTILDIHSRDNFKRMVAIKNNKEGK